MEVGTTQLNRAWAWHRWGPRWLPSRLSTRIKRMALRKYSAPIPCSLESGQKFVVRPNDFVQCEIGITGGWESLIYQAVRVLVQPGSVVLDIGAHVGYSAVLFAEWVGASGHVYCFEPLPPHAEQIAENMRLNDYQKRVSIIRKAASGEIGTASFHYSMNQNTGIGSLRVGRGHNHILQVETVALDAWRAANGIRQVDFLKLDVEGAEALVLEGMAEGLSLHEYSILLVELHASELPKFGSSVELVLSKIKEYGYRILYWESPGAFVTRPPASFGYVLAVSPKIKLDSGELRP